ncbi:hypothetical protein FDP41_011759 [Naegleria fowleri]|uniref:PPPDE domain-containing protein n=1 Tax=Naegleria fowleri TaxID=5763 RepID=A0A6A5C812_NAEFO|nr:uncharacterized protein FDP41_011759 [Naegleria fowleri]KAF0981898.1 hypothetical protein FDP41_011759 [Naegleria fowleri]
MVMQWMKASCIHSDVVKAIEKRTDFGGIQLYTLTLDKCINEFKIKERQASVFMLFVDKLRIDNVLEHGEPPADKLGGEEPPVLKQLPTQIGTIQNPYILRAPTRANSIMRDLSESATSSNKESSNPISNNNTEINFSPSNSIDIGGATSPNRNNRTSTIIIGSESLQNSSSASDSSSPRIAGSTSTTVASSACSGQTANTTTPIESPNIHSHVVGGVNDDERRPSRDDVELAMDLLYTVGEEEEEARYRSLQSGNSLDVNNMDIHYKAMMSADSSGGGGIDIPNSKLSFYMQTDASLQPTSYLSTSYDPMFAKISFGSVPNQPATDRYFASKGDDFKSISMMPTSTSTSMDDDKRKKRKPRRCSPFPEKKLTIEERERRDFCLKKIQQLRSPIAPKLHELVAQDCVIPERFRYKYFNPDRVDRPVHPSKLNLKIKLVITEMSTSTAHRILRKLGSSVGALKDQQFGMYHSALIIGEFYVEFCDSSIATVRKKSSSKAVFVVDIHTYKDQEEINNAFKVISEVICEWNGTKMYDNRKANCQHFALDILNRLQLAEPFFDKISGSVKRYLDRLRNDGVCEMNYTVDEKKRKIILNSKIASKELKDLVKQKGDISFPSHRLLDEFVYVIEKEAGIMYFDQNIQEQTDHMLLKAFDRAFWLRNEASSHNKDLTKPLDNERGEPNCPFSQVDKNGKLIDHTIHNTYLFTGKYSPDFPER